MISVEVAAYRALQEVNIGVHGLVGIHLHSASRFWSASFIHFGVNGESSGLKHIFDCLFEFLRVGLWIGNFLRAFGGK